jgi:hypothetical protein
VIEKTRHEGLALLQLFDGQVFVRLVRLRDVARTADTAEYPAAWNCPASVP